MQQPKKVWKVGCDFATGTNPVKHGAPVLKYAQKLVKIVLASNAFPCSFVYATLGV